jgi:hypothetical protein
MEGRVWPHVVAIEPLSSLTLKEAKALETLAGRGEGGYVGVMQPQESSARALAVREADGILAALCMPLRAADTRGGWTEDKRHRWMNIFAAITDDLANGRMPTDASHHLARWLDHEGIGAGPLYWRIVEFQPMLWPLRESSA